MLCGWILQVRFAPTAIANNTANRLSVSNATHRHVSISGGKWAGLAPHPTGNRLPNPSLAARPLKTSPASRNAISIASGPSS